VTVPMTPSAPIRVRLSICARFIAHCSPGCLFYAPVAQAIIPVR
jgi:hypothetical protein